MKSPAWALAVRFLEERQNAALRKYNEEVAEYKRQLQEYDDTFAEWRVERKRHKDDAGPPPERPREPRLRRYICSDTTVEALAVLLEGNPRGLLMTRDELSGWTSSFDAYKASRGADVAHWLAMHRAGSLTVDRKTGEKKIVHVPQAAVSIAGGVQPDILGMSLGGRGRHEELAGEGDKRTSKAEHFVNCLAARLLMAYPPRRPKKWTDSEISVDVTQRMNHLFDALLALEGGTDDLGLPQPVDVVLAEDAKAVFVEFYNDHAVEQVQLFSDLAAAWSKLEGYAARFALLIHLIRVAANDPSLENPDAIDKESMTTGITLSRWFGDEAVRIYSAIGGDSDSPKNQKRRRLMRLCRLVEKKGGAVTTRDVQRSSPQKYPKAADAEADLQTLVELKVGEWRHDHHDGGPGRPVRRFHLRDDMFIDKNDTNSVNLGEKADCVKRLIVSTTGGQIRRGLAPPTTVAEGQRSPPTRIHRSARRPVASLRQMTTAWATVNAIRQPTNGGNYDTTEPAVRTGPSRNSADRRRLHAEVSPPLGGNAWHAQPDGGIQR